MLPVDVGDGVLVGGTSSLTPSNVGTTLASPVAGLLRCRRARRLASSSCFLYSFSDRRFRNISRKPTPKKTKRKKPAPINPPTTSRISSAVRPRKEGRKYLFGKVYIIIITIIIIVVVRGFAKKKNQQNPRLDLLWKWVGGSRSDSEFFVLENRPEISLNQYRVY